MSGSLAVAARVVAAALAVGAATGVVVFAIANKILVDRDRRRYGTPTIRPRTRAGDPGSGQPEAESDTPSDS